MKVLQMEQIIYLVFGFLKMNLKQKAKLSQVCKEWYRFFTKPKFLHLIHWSFSICESFRKLEHDLDPKILFELSHVPYLSNLEITYNNSRADYLKPISLLTNLTKLVYVANAEMTRNSLSTLTKLRYLHINSVGNGRLSGNDDIFFYLTNLTCLNLSGQEVFDVKGIAGHAQLIELHLSFGKKIKHIQSLTKLENLTVFSCSYYEEITEYDLQFLSHLTSLQSLVLDHCSNIQDYKSIPILTNLKSLQLSDTRKISSIHFLSHLHLTKLNLSGCEHLDNIDVLHGNLHLVDLDVSHCPKIKNIPLLVNITSLNVAGLNQMNDFGLVSLTKSVKLTQLDLSRCDRLHDCLQYVCSTLEKLTLNNRSLNDLPQGLKDLKLQTPNFFDSSRHLSILELTQLRYLKIESISFDNRFKLQTLVHLIHLDIECEFVTDSIFDGIENLSQLRILTLDSDLITSKGMNQITNSSLESLKFDGRVDMNGCNFDALSLKYLYIIHGINMTDDEVLSISKLSLLENLSIPDTLNVTKQGLSHLSNLKNLKSLTYGAASEAEDSLFFKESEIGQYLTTLFSSKVHISKDY
jgi:hypothetical protein